ncbi:unnamed protein product [Darwinula stevensoni]|uniref:Uncharacterized protein n=1 Tax=Darwinula stevensoni TaxID=69355 RepID=A0A7R9A7U0_9CRUS|nr:unnamed protein product [Darwinula stevensoni]CAG0893453.1 unnamed protein product [Darwinula stevensoni]
MEMISMKDLLRFRETIRVQLRPSRVSDPSQEDPSRLLLLVGGGFAMAAAFQASRSSYWLGRHTGRLGSMPPDVLV